MNWLNHNHNNKAQKVLRMQNVYRNTYKTSLLTWRSRMCMNLWHASVAAFFPSLFTIIIICANTFFSLISAPKALHWDLNWKKPIQMHFCFKRILTFLHHDYGYANACIRVLYSIFSSIQHLCCKLIWCEWCNANQHTAWNVFISFHFINY